MSSDFHFLAPERFHKNLVQIGIVVSVKIRFEFVYVHVLGPRSRNDLDLQYSHTFIYSIRCLLLFTFRPLAVQWTSNGQEIILTFNTHIPSYI